MRDEELKWFRPLWLRVVVTGLVAIWFGWEVLIGRDTLWIVITGAALAYAVWNLFIKFDEKIGKTDTKDGEPKA